MSTGRTLATIFQQEIFDVTPAGFIRPLTDPGEIAALNLGLKSTIASGYRALNHAGELIGHNRIFDRIVARGRAFDLDFEDQCSIQYYFDLVHTLRDCNGQFDRVVEVGVFLGGSSSYLAGCAEAFDFDIDMVDIDANFLRFAYERVRQLYPSVANRVRLFHGDLPSYVRQVMLAEPNRTSVIHHDGSHHFEQVVKDLAALYYVRDRLFAVIAQDTHLRGTVENMNFVDLALYAVFGTDLKAAAIGAVYGNYDRITEPNAFNGNYFVPGAAEGLVLPIAENSFRYPHPQHSIDDFLPRLPEIDAPAA